MEILTAKNIHENPICIKKFKMPLHIPKKYHFPKYMASEPWGGAGSGREGQEEKEGRRGVVANW